MFRAKTYSEQERISGEEKRKYWREEIKNTLKEKRVQVRAEPVFDVKENKIRGYEIFSQILHHDRTTSSYGSILQWLDEFGMTNEYNLFVYSKAFRYFEDIDQDVHINISTDEIRNEEFIEQLFRLAMSFRMEDKLVIELKDTVNNENLKELQSFVAKTKQMGIRTAIDNVGVHYHKMSYLVVLDVDYINIDKGLISQKDDDPASLIVELVTAFVKQSDKKKIIGLKIETQAEYEKIKALGFDAYQGWLLKEDQIVF